MCAGLLKNEKTGVVVIEIDHRSPLNFHRDPIHDPVN